MGKEYWVYNAQWYNAEWLEADWVQEAQILFAENISIWETSA